MTRAAIRAIVAAVGVAVTLAGCVSQVDRAGTSIPDAATVVTMADVSHVLEIEPFVAAVAEVSHGRISLREAPNWRRRSITVESDLIRAVQRGDVPLALVPARAFRSVGIKSFDPLLAPMEVDSLALEQIVLGSSVGSEMLDSVRGAGIQALGFLPGPIRFPVGLHKAFLGPDDYQGARVAVSPSDVAVRTMQALGASAVGSTYFQDALAGDDGLEGQVAIVDGNTYDVPGTAITANVALWPRTLVLIAHTGALTTDVARALEQAALLSIRKVADEVVSGEQEATGNMCRRGRARFVSATSEQLAALRKALAPVDHELRSDPATDNVMSQIDDMRQSYPTAARDEAPRCPDSGGASDPRLAVTPIDGTYRMSSTLRQLRAISEDQADVPENYGDWVFIFDRGRFAFTQHNTAACTWGYGRLTVNGNDVVWDMLDGGGQAPTNALNKAGEHFVYTWVRYRDTLLLKQAPSESSPENFRVNPWRRISTSARPGDLDPRCRPPAQALPR